MNRTDWRVEFDVRRDGDCDWSLHSRDGRGVIIFLRELGGSIDSPTVNSVAVQWHEDGARVELVSDIRVIHASARAAWAHTPQTRVLESLPLEPFTPGMRRFWRRIFRLVRMPGGAWLLRWLARRSRP